jgi:hypothetical protein
MGDIMARILAYSFVLLCLFGGTAFAQYADQDSALFLKRVCSTDNPYTKGYCEGYVRALMVVYTDLRPDDKFCGFDWEAYPGGALGYMMRDYFAGQVVNNQETAITFMVRAMHEKFPCK